MGLEKNEGRKIFLNISDGKIVRQHQNPIEGTTVTRTNKNDKVVHEEFFSAITGTMTAIKSKETPFGMVWEVTLTDDGEEFVLSFNYSSRYANNFFRAIPNVDLSKKFSINPWNMKDKNDPSKKVIGLSLYQDKNKVEFAFTKEKPNGLPELVKRKVKGKDTWDDSEQLDFFEKLIKDQIIPQLGKAPVATIADEEVPEDAPF
jgi:hypothetical protein